MQKNKSPVTLVVSGIVIVLVSYVMMNAAGLGGVVIAPLFYIVGPLVFFSGIYQIFFQRNKGNLKHNLLIVGAIVVMTIIGILLAVLLIEMREDSCEARYGSRFGPEYKQCRKSLF